MGGRMNMEMRRGHTWISRGEPGRLSHASKSARRCAKVFGQWWGAECPTGKRRAGQMKSVVSDHGGVRSCVLYRLGFTGVYTTYRGLKLVVVIRLYGPRALEGELK